MSTRSTLLGSLVLIAYLATWFIWRSVDRAPLVWSALLWAGVLLAFFLARVWGERRSVWLNIAALAFAVAFVEGFLWIRQAKDAYVLASGVTLEGTYTKPNYFFLMPEMVLGYRPRPGVSVEAIKKYNGKLIYDVHYTVGENGLRVSPPANDDPAGCILFFGDSFTWGEAVQDDETVAYQLGALSGGKYRVYNFAFTGYSAHQMLAQIQSGVVKSAVTCDAGKPVYAIYQTLPNNVARVAGLGGWDRYGPRYILSKGGEVLHTGRFDQGESIANDRLLVGKKTLRWLAKAQIYERTLGRQRPLNNFDSERFFAVVKKSAEALDQQLPGVKFVVIVWNDLEERGGGPGSKAWHLREGLQRRELDVRSIEDILPGYGHDSRKYHIENDSHPTPEAHRLIASYLYTQLIARVHSRND